MPTLEKPVRQSVSLPPRVARRVKSLAKSKKTSANRVIVDLVESGLEAQELEKKRFFDLAERFRSATDPKDLERLGNELGRMVFGK